jgi:hypothetical protein
MNKTNCFLNFFKMTSFFGSATLLPLWSLLVAGCQNSDEMVRIHVGSKLYIFEAEKISSNLATPVVEAVARRNPNKVHIVACPHAPPQKIMQFEDELDARLQVDFVLSLSEEVC